MYNSSHFICAVLNTVHPCLTHVQIKILCSSVCADQHRLRYLLVSSTAGVWERSKMNWPALFPFSRAPKVAQHLPNCFRLSQRLPKPGDEMECQPTGSSCKTVTRWNHGRPWWQVSSIRVVDSWQQSEGHRLFTLISIQNILTVVFLQVWEEFRNYIIYHIPHVKEVDNISLPSGFFMIGRLRTFEFTRNPDSS